MPSMWSAMPCRRERRASLHLQTGQVISLGNPLVLLRIGQTPLVHKTRELYLDGTIVIPVYNLLLRKEP
jgi:hypothetical protein